MWMVRAWVVRLVAVALFLFPAASLASPNPTTVTIAGSLQSELGCAGDWQPDCALTNLTYDAADDVWQATFHVPAGSYEYKAALNGSWTENYGANATPGGANIPLVLAADTDVKFFYDQKTHWITSDQNAVIVSAPGSYQAALGCPGDWQPDCLRSWLEDPDGDGIYTFTANLPAGSYEVKAALDQSWSVNYGAGGVQNGPNIPFTVASECARTVFSYNAATHLLTVGPEAASAQPASVTIAGSLQSELGCPGDWDPACATTNLAFDAGDRVWQQVFNVPAGSWEYKAALDGGWAVNYGANATLNGANLSLNLAAPAAVKFYFDPSTHWIADNASKVIAVAPGSFQSALGCPGDWQPDCLRSWLEDPDGDGLYTFSTRALPAGNYETKVAINESWTENYGAGGAPGGSNIAFTRATLLRRGVLQLRPGHPHPGGVGQRRAQGQPQPGPGPLDHPRHHRLEDRPHQHTSPCTPAPPARWCWGPTASAAAPTSPLTNDPAGLPAAVLAGNPHLAGFSAFKLSATAGRGGRGAQGPAGGVGQGRRRRPGRRHGAAAPRRARRPLHLRRPARTDLLPRACRPCGSGPRRRARSRSTSSATRPRTATEAVLPMSVDRATGVWAVAGDAGWTGQYYLYEVEVFARATGRVEKNLVTDPYSVGLSRNSPRSQLVNLAEPRAQARGLGRPAQAAAGGARGHRALRAARARLQRQRRHRAGGGAGHLQGLRPGSAPTACATWRRWPTPGSPTCTCCRPSTSPPSTRTASTWLAPGDLSGLRARLGPAAGRGDGGGRPRRLQLGLRPVALHRARGQLRRPTPTAAGAHRSSSARWCRRSTASGCAW